MQINLELAGLKAVFRGCELGHEVGKTTTTAKLPRASSHDQQKKTTTPTITMKLCPLNPKISVTKEAHPPWPSSNSLRHTHQISRLSAFETGCGVYMQLSLPSSRTQSVSFPSASFHAREPIKEFFRLDAPITIIQEIEKFLLQSCVVVGPSCAQDIGSTSLSFQHCLLQCAACARHTWNTRRPEGRRFGISGRTKSTLTN